MRVIRAAALAGALPAAPMGADTGGAETGAEAGPIGADRAAALPAADVYVVGEVHGNPAHHEGQAAVIAAVRPAAVAFEMLTPERAAAWESALAGDMVALDAALGWREAGWPDPALYAPVFAALDGAMVLGAAPDPASVRAAVGDGAAGAFRAAGGDPGRYGLDRTPPPDEQAAREAGQQAAHCGALPEAMLSGFVEAQRLRDAAFARAVIEAAEAHGPPVVLITGTGHARVDWGVPAMLGIAAPDLTVVSVGQFEGPPSDAMPSDAAPPDAAPFDVVVVTDPPPGGRPDPCEGFAPPEG